MRAGGAFGHHLQTDFRPVEWRAEASRHDRRHADVFPTLTEGRNDLFHNEVLTSIAASHGKSVGQVVLRWLIQRGVIAIPKSVHKERIAENYAIWDFELSQEDMDRIATLDTACSLFFSHQDPAWVRSLGTRILDI